MVSNRIKTIASLVDAKDSILDIGTDHALLPIFLIKNNIISIADGSDISNKVLSNAKENVFKYNLEDKINLYLSDGVKQIDISKYNTLIITGMGFSTIKNIIDNADLKHIDKLIIQSNNNLDELRKYLNEISFSIVDETCLKDKDINYDIIVSHKGKQSLSEQEYMCGIYKNDNKWYYQENLDNILSIIEKVTDKSKKDNLKKISSYYKEYISR
jgi:tRNA (adenine22-N1)-methyltransferase